MSSIKFRLAVGSLALVLSVTNGYALDTNYVRFISGHDLIRTLRKTFPFGTSYLSDDCNRINPAQKDSLGLPSTLTGKPGASKPGPVYFQWWKTCIEKNARDQMSRVYDDTAGAKPNAFQEIVPPDWQERVRTNPWIFRGQPWVRMEPTLRQATLAHWFKRIGGYTITLDQKLWVEKMERRLLEQHSESTLEKIYLVVALSILTHEKFLTY